MGRKKPAGRDKAPRRGRRRSIRFDAYEEDPARKRREQEADKPPEVNLRRLHADEALAQLEARLLELAQSGIGEAVVVHGRGHGSEGGIPVLKALVREWCGRHSELVKSWREAPSRWGGAGAIVVLLRTR